MDLVGPKQLVPRRDAPSRATISGVIAVPLKGRLLIASPALADTNFDHTIVLVVEHSDEGALGLVLNRPSVAAVADALPGWAPVAADPAVVFVGGPVSPDAAIGLALAFFAVKPLAMFLVPGLKPADPLSFCAVLMVLAVTGFLASERRFVNVAVPLFRPR